MDANWVEKVGEAVMAFSALASLVNHAVRKKQEAGEAIAGWLLQLNALLNVGALNLDMAVQQFKAAKASGSKVNVIEILQSLVKGKSPALEALLKKAAEVEQKADEKPHVVGITSGEGIKLVDAPVTLVKDAEVEAKEPAAELPAVTLEAVQKSAEVYEEKDGGNYVEPIADKVELTVSATEEEQLATPEESAVVVGLAGFAKEEEAEEEEQVVYVTEAPKKRVLKTAAAKAKVAAKKSAPKKSDKAKK